MRRVVHEPKVANIFYDWEKSRYCKLKFIGLFNVRLRWYAECLINCLLFQWGKQTKLMLWTKAGYWRHLRWKSCPLPHMTRQTLKFRFTVLPNNTWCESRHKRHTYSKFPMGTKLYLSVIIFFKNRANDIHPWKTISCTHRIFSQ